ncbi:MAG: AAA family ATPase [Dehalococcoidia bacterium]
MTQDHEALPEYVRALLTAEAYPHAPTAEVELRQTHISYVFLADDTVYKTKKPVDFGFISQLDLATRKRLCEAEVRLNRRLTRDVYLDAVPVVRRPNGTYAVDPPESAAAGEVIEWAVKMRRLPDDATLDQLLEAGTMPPDLLARTVRRLIGFHEAAAVVKNDPPFAGAEAVRAWWAREYGEAEGFIGDSWRPEDAASLQAFATATIEGEASLFDLRLAAGRVVEGHGDLHAKHVYVLGPEVSDLQIVDCIEFNDWFHFRYLDVGYDVAFLAMDLEARGHPALGDEFAGRYLAASNDETLGVLQPLHRAFRAFVRGKVESIGAHAPEVGAAQRADLAASAARYFELASSYGARRRGPALVLMSGLSGTGKSIVGATLAGRIGAAYVSSDAVRKRLAGLDPTTPVEGRYREGIYAPDVNERTYATLREAAAAHLEAGRPVVLDATHQRAADRTAALEVARAAGVPSVIAELRLDDTEARRRIEARAADPMRTSDATWEIYERQREAFEAVEPSEGAHLVLDAASSPAELAWQIAEALPPRD